MSYEKKRKAHARHTTYMRRYFTRCRLVVNSLSACLSLLWACRITGYVKLRFPKFAWIVFSAGFCGGGFDSLVYLYININIYIFILMYRYIYLYIIIYLYYRARVRACTRVWACVCVYARESYANTSKSDLVMLYSLNFSLNHSIAAQSIDVWWSVNDLYNDITTLRIS